MVAFKWPTSITVVAHVAYYFFLVQFTYFNSGTVFMYTLIIPKKTGKDEEIHKCYFVPPDVKNVCVDKY